MKFDKKRHARQLRRAFRDFYAFCGLLWIKPKSGGRIRFKLNATQLRYLRDRTQRDNILKGRQIGMTTVLLALDLYHFLTHKGAAVQIVVQSDDERKLFKEIAGRIALFIASLRQAGWIIKFTSESTGYWEMRATDGTVSSLRISVAGGSQQKAEKGGRGATITRLHLTESAFYEWPEATFNALNESVPGIEYGSEIVNESTANGAGGHYHEQWNAAVLGTSGYKAHFFPWFLHEEYDLGVEPGEVIVPENDAEKELIEKHGIRPGQLKWYRRKLAEKGKELTRQEYPSDPETCFLVSGRPFFDVDALDKMARAASDPIKVESHGNLRIWEEPVKDERYVLSADIAEGESLDGRADTSDYDAAVVLRRKDRKHVATLHGRWPTHDFARALAALGRRYNDALIVPERNNHGHAVLEALIHTEHYAAIFLAPDKKLGFHTNVMTRPVILDELEDAVRLKRMISPDRRLIGEHTRFVIHPNGKPAATNGTHDDLVLAMAIGWHVCGLPSFANTQMSDFSLI